MSAYILNDEVRGDAQSSPNTGLKRTNLGSRRYGEVSPLRKGSDLTVPEEVGVIGFVQSIRYDLDEPAITILTDERE